MKEAGRTIKDTIMDLNYLQAGIHTKESTLTGKHTAKVFIIGSTGNRIKGNFLKEWSKVTVFGMEQSKTHILELGNRIKQMVMEFMYGWMETDMRDPGKSAWEMGMELIFFKIKISILVSTFKVYLMAMVNMNGKMEISIVVILIKVSNKERANGNKNHKIKKILKI